ncbi:lysophospholipid acyltransferase family protein [Aureibacter tunicatorum]|uniref:KDO2-lipid IV(A) lauroyltransferase n=1 Tax=Aureibacter tunicatorum TaxID=866807 RepID=A0AAE3XJ81_9BACT|nr:lysophospholipid acyltransferase family protein [Aureibacter tunicatorum]MDR6237738.1 KDO2-lipid IV(A) lauroyltransferase [Aureibacter tunicatorum]BDD02773.1 lipid A biosynthesis protein [Aureibacter tunicatorum]
MDKLTYYLYKFFVATMKLVPMKSLYVFGYPIYLLIHKVFRYRKGVISKNLRNSFPEKSEEELKELEKQVYVNTSDLLLETIKGTGIRRNVLQERFKIKQLDVLNHFAQQGRSAIFVGGHTGNWEWAALALGLQAECEPVIIYRELSNKLIDEEFRQERKMWGSRMVSTKETRTIFSEKSDAPTIYIMLSDQSPVRPHKAHWVNFLNQETGFIHGFELQARRYNLPVLFFDIHRTSRGYYECNIEILAEDPTIYKTGELTALYAKRLEKAINEHPADYLWTHNRWKKKRPENKPLIQN